MYLFSSLIRSYDSVVNFDVPIQLSITMFSFSNPIVCCLIRYSDFVVLFVVPIQMLDMVFGISCPLGCSDSVVICRSVWSKSTNQFASV